MNDLIKVTYENDTPTILGRDLHEFLEVKARYNDWFPRMCEYGFSEGAEFYSILSKTTEVGGRPATDHQLTIEMAKEIAMLQRNEKGKQARQYFINLEKAWNTPEAVMARALRFANTKLEQAKTHNLMLEQKVAEYEPKAQYVDYILKSPGALAITQIAADYGLSARKLNKILHEERVQHNVGGQWILYAEHMSLGYTKSETIHFVHSDGTPDTKLNTKWTQKGRLFIHGILERRGIVANVDRKGMAG